MNLENVKAGDKIRFSNGTAESTQEREVERVTKTQIVCLDKNGEKQKGFFATKFNKTTGRQVGDWTVPYFVVSVVEPVAEEKAERIAFNTGRYYGPNKQRIIAQATPHGDVYFSDIDRGITGIICNIPLDQSAIIREYDAGAYRPAGSRELPAGFFYQDEAAQIYEDIKAEESDQVARLHGVSGLVTCALMVKFGQQSLLSIVRCNTGFSSFADLVNAKGDYRPSIDCSVPELAFLADKYDAHQSARGDARRAFRYGSEEIKAERKAQAKAPKAANRFQFVLGDVYENTGNPTKDRLILAIKGTDLETGPGLGREHDELVAAAKTWLSCQVPE